MSTRILRYRLGKSLLRQSIGAVKLIYSFYRDFQEALSITAKAKSRFAEDELTVLRRGHELIRRSVECGVTSMRAHVEVDSTVNNVCVDVGLRLRDQFKDQCDVQIAGTRVHNLQVK